MDYPAETSLKAEGLVSSSRWVRGVLLALPLLFSGTVRAEVSIALENRVRNLPEGRCAWCALETLGRHHGIMALHGLADQHPTRATQSDLEAALDELRVDYRTQPAGSRSTTILRYAIHEDLGAIVGFRERVPGQGSHMVTLVDFGTDSVRVIDSNDADGRVRTMSLKRFLSWWDGFALVLERHEEE
jgi:ABC-type bacteriocin/lantibiotic exporter with double-glycine peptidase domain